MKKAIAVLTIAGAAGFAQAASLSSIDSNYSGLLATPTIIGWDDAQFGTIVANREVRATFSYLSQHSSYDNGTAALDIFVGEKQMGEVTGATMVTKLSAGDLNFWFTQNGNDSVHNSDGRKYKWDPASPDYPLELQPAFAILAEGFGGFDYILGFNDKWGDLDFNDYVMGVNLVATPLPAAAWLFGSAAFGLGLVGRRKHAQSAEVAPTLA